MEEQHHASGNAAALPRNQILVGDAHEQLSRLASSTVDCVITSPPYFGLRDYGHVGQLGLEANVDGWAEQVRAVCRDIARVLKPTGSLWLNVADSYSNHLREGTAKKSLLLGPQRLSLALAQDGWIIRNQVVWAKTNPMPSSVTDRLSCTYEVLLFLVRSRYYFFDLNAIRVPLVTASSRPGRRGQPPVYPPRDAMPPGSSASLNSGLGKLKAAGQAGHPLGKNPGDIWSLATAGYRGAHFATFPPGLIERPLLATCPARVCTVCGAPWRRRAGDPPGVPAELRPACTCTAEWRRGLVLDPFLGSGTTALVAERYERDWLGIELNPAYAALAAERLARSRERRGQPATGAGGRRSRTTTAYGGQ